MYIARGIFLDERRWKNQETVNYMRLCDGR